MKVFFDSNAYIAEALLGGAAEQMIAATIAARWRIFLHPQVLEEIERILVDKLRFSSRLARMTRNRVRRRSILVNPPAPRHSVPADPADSAILQAAIAAGVDLLITNDKHLLALNPYEGIRLISMTDYIDLLKSERMLSL
jgi:putative PIN family toxin of toxin-antitoxin system